MRTRWHATLTTVLLAAGACAPGELTRDAEAAPDAARPVTDAAPDVAMDALAAMEAGTDPNADLTPDNLPDGVSASMDATAPALAVGYGARVTATALNLRSGPGTSNAVLTSMPCGTLVDVIDGPTNNWWNLRYSGMEGWSSGAYLIAASAFDPAVCMMTPAGDAGGAVDAATMPDGAAMPTELASIFQLARSAVGYSYYWGHGSWGTDGASHGSCSGSCPSCSHTGSYGADCSGFVAKVWQVPTPSPVTTDLHPYSTNNFFNQTTHWSRVDRAHAQPADAMVYNTGSEGHIFLYESADPWGSMWTYEARGCSTGIVHNLRTASSAYVAIRREGL